MVSVTFVDAGSGSLIGRTELPPDQLPDTFEVATTLEIAGTHYSVERAEPPRSAQFRASGELTLFLRPLEVMAPQDILYSLPTICDWLPELDPLLDMPVRFEMHEDDWRQIEFVDASLAPVVEAQRRMIRVIIDNHSHRDSEGRLFGFDKIHIRTEPLEPLPHGLSLRLFLNLLQPDRAYAGVGFAGQPGGIPHSFAFGTGSLVCYGLALDDSIKVLGLNEMPGIDLPLDGVMLVNWLTT